MITVSIVALFLRRNPDRMAAAVGSSYLFRALGAVLGIALSNALQQNTLKTGLVRVIIGAGASKLIDSLREDMYFVRKLSPALQPLVLDVYVYQDAGRSVFFAATIVAVCAVSYFLSVPLRFRKNKTDRWTWNGSLLLV